MWNNDDELFALMRTRLFPAVVGDILDTMGLLKQFLNPSIRPLRGDMVVLAPPEIAMNGKPDRLSPGVRIRDMNDQLVLSGPLVNQPLVVNYLRDNTGQVQQVWILNSEEAREKRRGILDMIFNWGSDTTAAPVDDGKTPYGQLPAYQP